MNRSILLLCCCLFFVSCNEEQSILDKINRVVYGKNLTLGVSIYDVEDGELHSLNGDRYFPMQSVYKFHIALKMLDVVDRGVYSLMDSISIDKSRLLLNTWSPFREKYPNGRVVTLLELLEYVLIYSDNNISDVVMEIAGGPSSVQGYLVENGVAYTNIVNYERELKSNWELQFHNFTTPNSIVKLLNRFNSRELLSDDLHNFLWDSMAKTNTGSIRDSISKVAVIAHKSGFSGVGDDGVIAANNDIGIMELPNGSMIIFAIFITNSKETISDTYSIISKIGSIIYDHYR